MKTDCPFSVPPAEPDDEVDGVTDGANDALVLLSLLAGDKPAASSCCFARLAARSALYRASSASISGRVFGGRCVQREAYVKESANSGRRGRGGHIRRGRKEIRIWTVHLRADQRARRQRGRESYPRRGHNSQRSSRTRARACFCTTISAPRSRKHRLYVRAGRNLGTCHQRPCILSLQLPAAQSTRNRRRWTAGLLSC